MRRVVQAISPDDTSIWYAILAQVGVDEDAPTAYGAAHDFREFSL